MYFALLFPLFFLAPDALAHCIGQDAGSLGSGGGYIPTPACAAVTLTLALEGVGAGASLPSTVVFTPQTFHHWTGYLFMHHMAYYFVKFAPVYVTIAFFAGVIHIVRQRA